MQNLKQKFIRDFTSVMPRSKSEAKRRLDEIIDKAVEEARKDERKKIVAKDKYYKMGQEAERERIYEEKLNLIL